jgi:hypothetical protein
MGIVEDAFVSVVVADHITLEPTNKIYALGLGVSFLGLAPNGLTPPLSVAALMEFPAKYAGTEFSVSLELRDETAGHVVSVLMPPDGHKEALRVQQLMSAEAPALPNLPVPHESPCRAQVVLGFAPGLQLAAGHYYRWRFEINGQHRKGWSTGFGVVGMQPNMPVFGGPTTPAPTDLPTLDND